MGFIYGNFTLRNARKRGLAAKTVRALVDTGANTLCILRRQSLPARAPGSPLSGRPLQRMRCTPRHWLLNFSSRKWRSEKS
jgi:hypothetical protein